MRLALLALATVVTDQILLHTLLADDLFMKKRVAPFDPPVFNETQALRLQKLRDLVAKGRQGDSSMDVDLGWCPRPGRKKEFEYDWSGSLLFEQPLAKEKDPQRTRIAVVGCSFARGDEVAPADSWAGRLAREHEEIEIANLGMGGYGIDQSFLRWRRDAQPLDPDQVWLIVMPTALMRITTQFPPIQNHWTAIITLKPCFTLASDGSLVLHKMPAQSIAEEVALLDDQAAYLERLGARDMWIQRLPAAYAPHGSHWLHATALGRLALTWLDQQERDAGEWIGDSTHDVHKLALAILKTMHQEVSQTGSQLRVLVLPSRKDLQQREEAGGKAYWDELFAALSVEGCEVFDASEALQQRSIAGDDDCWMPGGHYSPKANAMVAEIVKSSWLTE